MDVASKQWDNILLHLLQYATPEGQSLKRSDLKQHVPDAILEILVHAKLLVITEDGDKAAGKKRKLDKAPIGTFSLSNQGWCFLLSSQSKQLWALLKSYVELHKKKDVDELEVIVTLLNIAFWILGYGEYMSTLDASSKQMVIDWTSLGLTYRPDGITYYPTHFAAKLLEEEQILSKLLRNTENNLWEDNLDDTASLPKTEKNANQIITKEEGYIIVESNFHLYAYTNSGVKTKIISLFTNIQYVLPNMVTGIITRSSILNVLKKGVMADTIIGFLKDHFHPKMSTMSPSVVDAITTQIHLWSAERSRVNHNPGVLYDKFKDKKEFNAIRQYASDLGVLIWENTEKEFLFVQEDAHPVIRDFIRSLK
eukprot:TRINITY_DN5528_c0_g1_i2.p1 TRINITY_DN5528_c0_g1~~TRINITY_DN5528_c0_g1_i2.p1  ORF type:complete len:367 (-),score=55.45 TRINITY_DN5528_c0_g1_i2:38-1138(-)